MLFSILIPTIPERRDVLGILLVELNSQISRHQQGEFIEICTYESPKTHDGGPSIGAKRQWLLEKAIGQYVAFIDDDDMVTKDYIPAIMEAIAKQPDVIGINGWMTTDKKNSVPWFISLGLPYMREDKVYKRPPNHLAPTKREMVLQIGFKDMNYGEDRDYCIRLKNSGILKNEVIVTKPLYHYQFSSKAR